VLLLIFGGLAIHGKGIKTAGKIRNLEISLAVKTKENDALKEELKKLRATCSVYGPAPIIQPKPVEVAE